MSKASRTVTGAPKQLRRLVSGGAAAVFAVSVLLHGAASPVQAADDEQAEIDRKVAQAGDSLADANAAVSAATAQLQAAEAQLPAAQQALDDAVAKEASARQEYQAAKASHEQAVAEYEAAKQRLAQIEAQYEDLRANVGDFARRAYQMGPFAEIEMILDASDPVEFTDRLEAIRSVSKSNNAALGDMATNRADQSYTELRMDALEELAEEQRQIAEAKLREAEAAKAAAEEAKRLIDDLIAQRDAALAVAESQRAAVQGQYAALQAEQKRIAAAAQRAAELARQAAAAAAIASAGAAVGSPGPASSDGYIWPITGARISQLSGPRIHPLYGYRSCHTGVDISGGYGTPILAVQTGVVATINNGGPYGLHTIVAHGGGVASFYAHQSRTIVSPGQTVQRGDVIGYVGSTGFSTGPHLHFELHIDGVPFNPLGWYGQSKYAIRC